jgi:protease I
MTTSQDTRKVAFLVAAEGIERVELTEPWKAVADAGFEPVLVSPEPGKVQTFDHLDRADTQPVDVTVAEAQVDDFAALVLPGGVANPDALRLDEDAVSFTRDFLASGRPLAAICHAPWTLVEAGVLEGRSLTSWPSVRTDITNAGGSWRDERVVVDGNLITSRKPDDLPAFISALLEALQHGDAGRTGVAAAS